MTKEEQVVKYYYAHISEGIIEKHIDEITGELIYSQTHKGNEGDPYNIPSKEFEGYDLVEGKIKYHWNTEDCITLDKIPYIGNFSSMWDNAYVATGFNKWGITTSIIAAKIITDKILGEKNEYEEIFKATRLEPIKNIKEVTNMVKESVNSLVVKKLEVPQEEANQIQNGEGKIVEVNGQKIGIYKDDEGPNGKR